MRVILDTGPWVALIDRSEARHQECIDWLEHFAGEIYTTEAVLTEVLYLVNFSLRAQSAAIEQILLGLMVLVPTSLSSLKRAKRLMEKYHNIPMDYADATLVCLAEDLSISEIVTFDKRDFGIYRPPSGRPFHLLP
jgi:predicted nucleic acid-binding protein